MKSLPNTYAKNRRLVRSRWLIPDAIVAMKRGGEYRSMALELELNYKNSRRYQQIFSEYIRKKSLSGVLYVSKSKALGQHVERQWNQCSKYGRDKFFGWCLLEDVLKDPLRAPVYGEAEGKPLLEMFDSKLAQYAAHPGSTCEAKA